ncbi:MAG: transcriptional regulator MntR [Syntrophomonadales bacterium]|jgi:Mn-dependent DtxR family transcriptional regulator
MKRDDDILTASMEDYLEMVYRLSRDVGFTRVNEIASALNVQPPSVSKMIQKLAEQGMVDYEKYGYIILTRKGKKLGKELLYRHQVVEDFLRLLGVTEGLLDQTEKIEHTLNPSTLKELARLVRFLKERPELVSEYRDTEL